MTETLRETVLAGRYFGARHADGAAALAEFLTAAPAQAIALWFGMAPAELLRDPARIAARLDHDIATIDSLIAAQLDAILHHPRFTRLEGSWRGLAWLAGNLEPGRFVKLRALNVTWAEICRDLARAPEFDQSMLFRRIYEDEFGTPGGEPYGLMVLDYEVRHRPAPEAPTDDIAALASLAGIAAAAFAPMILAPSPVLFGVDRLSELAGVARPAAVLTGPEYQRFRGLSNREDIRFLGLALPRLRARPPWRETPAIPRGFRYDEHPASDSDIPWFAAGYAIALAAGRAMARFGWPADMRGYVEDRDGGGLVVAGTAPHFSTDPEEGLGRFETELALTEQQERDLVDAGMMALTPLGFGGEAVLGAARAMQTPRRYTGPRGQAAEANARLSAQFNAMICVARFAHYVKVIGRDMTGAFRTPAEVERELNDWLSQYVNGNIDAGAETRARYPLLAASVEVRELPAKPGNFGCVIQLQPHYQLDDIAASFRLVTELAAPGKAA